MSATVPHPTSAGYAAAYSHAWTHDTGLLTQFFADNGVYTDVAMGGVYRGHAEIIRFHRYMLKFAADSYINFYAPAVQEQRAYFEWEWGGSITGPLRLPNGNYLEADGRKFSATGIASCRFDPDGKLLSHRDFWDIGLLANQLGYGLNAAALPAAQSSPAPR